MWLVANVILLINLNSIDFNLVKVMQNTNLVMHRIQNSLFIKQISLWISLLGIYKSKLLIDIIIKRDGFKDIISQEMAKT